MTHSGMTEGFDNELKQTINYLISTKLMTLRTKGVCMVADKRVNTEAYSEKPMRSVRFFNLYFSGFGQLVLANLFLLPFDLLAAGSLFLTYHFLGGINIVAAAASLIILNIGMSGTALICRYICEEKEFSAFAAFKKGLKDNSVQFLLHGIIFFAVFAVSYFSVILYYNGTKTNAVFWLPLIITALIAAAALFALYYPNVMTVTMDIPMKDIYRNCLLFSFGELKNNLMATAALLILGAVIFTIAYIINNMLVILVILGALQIFVIPSTVQYIITFYVYDDMVGILDETRRNRRDDEDEEEKASAKPVLNKEEAEDISRILPDEDKDEYIFYNGRMIKRSEIEKFL